MWQFNHLLIDDLQTTVACVTEIDTFIRTSSWIFILIYIRLLVLLYQNTLKITHAIYNNNTNNNSNNNNDDDDAAEVFSNICYRYY